jgi:protein-S-isoprenylcysteine O-methyltransferase Ste14
MLTYVAAAIVIVVYAVAFRIPARQKVVGRKAKQSWAGIILVAASFSALFLGMPRRVNLFGSGWYVPPNIVAGIASALTIAGAVFMVWARRTLGKQWSFGARTVEGHQLITRGPYAVVRNPIYASLALMIVALGMTFATPTRVAVALALYLTGSFMRIRAEEELMRTTFGEAWEAYRRRVPALIPWLSSLSES